MEKRPKRITVQIDDNEPFIISVSEETPPEISDQFEGLSEKEIDDKLKELASSSEFDSLEEAISGAILDEIDDYFGDSDPE